MRYRLRIWDAKASFVNVECNPWIKQGDVIQVNGIRYEVLRRISVGHEVVPGKPSDPFDNIKCEADLYDELIVKQIPANI